MLVYFSNAKVAASAKILAKNINLNDIKTSGSYTFFSATKAAMVNMSISVSSEIRKRMYYSSTWYPWKKVYNRAGKVLWPGVYYMSANQTATLFEKVVSNPMGLSWYSPDMLMELLRTMPSIPSSSPRS